MGAGDTGTPRPHRSIVVPQQRADITASPASSGWPAVPFGPGAPQPQRRSPKSQPLTTRSAMSPLLLLALAGLLSSTAQANEEPCHYECVSPPPLGALWLACRLGRRSVGIRF